MKITKSEFVISAAEPQQFPRDALPEIALAGRSNVGKSSFINCLVQRKNLARTSSVPGKTQTLNFYRINDRFYFVDVPGYGYAKASKAQRERWGRLIEGYLRERRQLKMVVLIIDSRHPPTKDDVAMYEWLVHYDLPRLVVATKADKLPRSKWDRHGKLAAKTLNLRNGDTIILFSAETGMGKGDVWDNLLPAVAQEQGRDN